MIPAVAVDAAAPAMAAAREAAEPDPESTIAIPTPGRKRDADAPTLPAAPAAGSPESSVDVEKLGGLNPLIAAANPVLAVVAQIRHTLKHPDPEGLRASLGQGIAAFESGARAAGAAEETVTAASAALSALVNESASSTPWGVAWGSSDGEEFFRLLERYSADLVANRDLLEFFYVCLALGYEGRYRNSAGGREELAQRRLQLFEQVRTLRSGSDGELSSHWRGVVAPALRPPGPLGLWVAGSGVALLLAIIYVFYSVSLGGASDPVARTLAQLKAATAAEGPRPASSAATTTRVAEQLSAEVTRGEVAIADAGGASTIVIRSDRLFASGSARLEAGVEPVVLRVADALDQVPGTIVVTGHTDDVPIRTARFPSNWELSTERAASVVKLMSGKIKDAGRLRAEGLADSAPAAPNDSPANRARNRRVEIVLRSEP
jgi:type VI secretion system protein ImpK